MNRERKKAVLKNLKKAIVVNIASLSLVGAILLGSLGYERINQNTNQNSNMVENVQVQVNAGEDTQLPTRKYKTIHQLRSVELPTYSNTFKDDDGIRRMYDFVHEEDVLNLSTELKYATEEYLRSYGASYWTNPDEKQFWPEDMEYIVAAIAHTESSYRINSKNKKGYGGITGFDDVDSLKTLREQWFVSHIWGSNIPDVDCSSENFDMFNPNQCMELTYHYLGYTMANRFKKDKHFIDDYDGARRCIWDKLEFSEETQTRLMIASYFWGIGNVTNSVFGHPNDKGEIVSIDDYLYSSYVEKVLAKTYELKNTYGYNLER